MSRPTGPLQRGKSVRRASTVGGSVVSLSYPSNGIPEPSFSDLGALTDQRSKYHSVMRSCLTMNQFAGIEVPVIHDSSYARTVNGMLNALRQCVELHEDRRCRVLACKTLAVVARSAYARIRHSPLLFSTRESILNRLEDEVGTDIPVALCRAALEDSDDGVSASAVEALGIITLSSSAMVGSMVDDELLRDVEAIAHVRPSPYAPSLSNLSDEDPAIPQMELQSRVFEKVLTPRIWRLVRRILNYDQSADTLKTIPFLTACLAHLIRIHSSNTLGMDRSIYAKRWIEVDVPGLLYDVVTGILIPSMKDCPDGALAYAATMSGLRLANVRPCAPWVSEVCRWASISLMEQLAATQIVEHKMGTLASLLISLRAIPLENRVTALRIIINDVRFLPSTTTAASTITSPGFKVGNFYRRPARIGYLSEVALSFLVDGSSNYDRRSDPLEMFFNSPEVRSLVASRSEPSKRNLRKWNSHNSLKSSLTRDTDGDTILGGGGKKPTEEFSGSHVAEEFILAFCRVASAVGEHLFSQKDDIATSKQVQEWFRCTAAILKACSCCVTWKSRTLEESTHEEDKDERTLFTMLTACQAAYVRLLMECFYAVGLLSPSSSVSLYLVPVSTPPRILLLEDLAHAVACLSRFRPLEGAESMWGEMSDIADDFLEYKFRERIPSRHIRIALIAAFADQWVQEVAFQNPDDFSLNQVAARELLTLLSEEISTMTLEVQNDSGMEELYFRYLETCVAAVENIALVAFEMAHQLDSENEFNEDIGFIISAATSALRGINLRHNTKSNNFVEYDALPMCIEAVHRIEATVSSSSSSNGDIRYHEHHLVHSLIVTSAAHDFQVRMSNLQPGEICQFSSVLRSPLFDDHVDAPLVIDDSHIHAYFVHFCQQIVNSRIDLSILSSSLMNLSAPVMDADENGMEELGKFRSKNFLRLTPPPFPPQRMPVFGTPLGSRVNWAGSVTTLSGGSDPISFVMAYSMRRSPRYDCEPEFRLMVSLRVQNLTAVAILKGVRMDLRVTQQRSAFEAEGENVGVVLKSITAYHKQEVKAGDQVTWEVAVDHWPMKGYIELHPSVTIREIEGEQTPAKLVNGDIPACDYSIGSFYGADSKEPSRDSKSLSKSTTDEESTGSATGTDHTDGNSAEERTIGDEEDENMDIVLSSEPVQLSPMLGMQPCPLVFFRDGRGDVSTFRFLWYQMPHRMPEMMLFPSQLPGRLIGSSVDDFGAAVAGLSTIPIEEDIDGIGTVTLGWAFMTLKGDRMMCIMIESVEVDQTGIESPMATLHFRADNEALLYSIMGSDSTRNIVVNSLTGDQWTCDDQVNSLLGL